MLTLIEKKKKPRGGGVGGILWISSDGDHPMGEKIKTPKHPWTKNLPPKKPMLNL